MPIYVGDKEIKGVYIGNSEAKAIYAGTNQVYPSEKIITLEYKKTVNNINTDSDTEKDGQKHAILKFNLERVPTEIYFRVIGSLTTTTTTIAYIQLNDGSKDTVYYTYQNIKSWTSGQQWKKVESTSTAYEFNCWMGNMSYNATFDLQVELKYK